MQEYESLYEEYKQSLLRSVSFRSKLMEKYRNTIHAEEDYINKTGVLDKTIGLSLVCGFCYALALALVQLNHFPGILIRILLAIVGTVCFFGALYVGSAFKKTSGKANFRSFYYERCIKERVMSDKETELKCLLHNLLSGQITKEEFRKQYEALSRYDNYLSNLMDDTQLEEVITKNM